MVIPLLSLPLRRVGPYYISVCRGNGTVHGRLWGCRRGRGWFCLRRDPRRGCSGVRSFQIWAAKDEEELGIWRRALWAERAVCEGRKAGRWPLRDRPGPCVSCWRLMDVPAMEAPRFLSGKGTWSDSPPTKVSPVALWSTAGSSKGLDLLPGLLYWSLNFRILTLRCVILSPACKPSSPSGALTYWTDHIIPLLKPCHSFHWEQKAKSSQCPTGPITSWPHYLFEVCPSLFLWLLLLQPRWPPCVPPALQVHSHGEAFAPALPLTHPHLPPVFAQVFPSPWGPSWPPFSTLQLPLPLSTAVLVLFAQLCFFLRSSYRLWRAV